MLSSILAAPIYISPNNVQRFSLLHIFINTCYLSFWGAGGGDCHCSNNCWILNLLHYKGTQVTYLFDNIHFNKHLTVVFIHIFLMMSDVEHFFKYLTALL